jgi:glycerol-3-phosphate acyltransferase PlsY
LLRIISGIIPSYLIGSILVGPILARVFRSDLKSTGSGNPGATNAFRVIGPLAGFVVLAGDAIKGWLAVFVGGIIAGGSYLPLFGLAAIFGHNWSVFHGFKGGKGIATSLGVIIALCPRVLLIILPSWFLITLLSGFVSLGSVIAALMLPIAIFLFYQGNPLLVLFAFGTASMAVYRHVPNLNRLFRGEENRLFSLWRRKEKDK